MRDEEVKVKVKIRAVSQGRFTNRPSFVAISHKEETVSVNLLNQNNQIYPFL